MEGSFEEIARDYCPNWMTAVEVCSSDNFLDDTILVCHIFRFWTMTPFWVPRTTTTYLSVKETLAPTQTKRDSKCRRFRKLSTFKSLMNPVQGRSDPHWGHGECVPAREPGDAEPGGQHHSSHWLRTLWHRQWLNRARHSVTTGV